MKFKDWYEKKYSCKYPSDGGERLDVVLERIADAISGYLDWVVVSKYKK